jgi:uncharacterized protein YecT (DUF1311 family)
MNRPALAGLLFAGLMGAIYAADPSFDCHKTKVNSIESVICSSELMSALDRKMVRLYKLATATGSGARADTVKKEQVAWLKERNQCGKMQAQEVCTRDPRPAVPASCRPAPPETDSPAVPRSPRTVARWPYRPTRRRCHGYRRAPPRHSHARPSRPVGGVLPEGRERRAAPLQRVFAQIIDVFHPRAIRDPCRNLIRLQGNWYKETHELGGQHGHVNHANHPDTMVAFHRRAHMAVLVMTWLWFLAKGGMGQLGVAKADAHETVDAACADKSVHTGEATLGGGDHAVDDLCDSLGLMAVGTGDLLHSGGIHPYSLGHCDRRGADSSHSGAQAGVALARQGGR